MVNELYWTAMEQGASSNGKPGFRPEYHEGYYGAFIKDADLNHIEAVTFVQ